MPARPSQHKSLQRYPINTPGKLYYGPWPNVSVLSELKNNDVDTIWNLAEELDNLIPLEKYFVPNVIHGNIEDYYIPENIGKFAIQLNKVVAKLKAGKNVFIHCFGGHGRTGMTLAAIELFVNDINPKDALRKSFSATGGPEEKSQYNFIHDLYSYLHGEPIPKRKRENRWENIYNQKGPDPISSQYAGAEWWDAALKKQPIDRPKLAPFLEWLAKHPEHKDYDTAKAHWAKEQKAHRKSLKNTQSEPEFCLYCGAHLIYPRDADHVKKHEIEGKK